MKRGFYILLLALCLVSNVTMYAEAQSSAGKYSLEISDIYDIKGINGKYHLNVAAAVTDLKNGNVLTTGAKILLDFYSYDSFYYSTCQDFTQRYFELRQNPLNTPKTRLIIEGQGSLYLGEKGRVGRAEIYQWSINDPMLICQLRN